MNHCHVEFLEQRIAPASLTFTDVDGDKVVITTSKGTLALGGNVIVTAGQLEELDVSAAAFEGANVSIVATRGDNGDGHVNVGFIDGTGRHLGTVLVDGDLGQIDAGDVASGAVAIKSLRAVSMGEFGTSTQAAGNNLESDINGKLGKLVVTGNIRGALIDVDGGANGDIGSISITGSLLGGSSSFGGVIQATSDIGPVKIGGSIVGGFAAATGALSAAGKMGSLTIGGNVVGGFGEKSGYITAVGMGSVKIGGDLKGGFSNDSGRIECFGALPSLSVGGSILGSAGLRSGSFFASGPVGSVKVKVDVSGGSEEDAGSIVSEANLGTITIGGDLSGGFNGLRGGSLRAVGKIGSVTIGGDLNGGGGELSARIAAGETIGPVKILGRVSGGSGMNSATIEGTGGLGAVTIGGSMVGGASLNSARIIGPKSGPITIGGDLMAGPGFNSGVIAVDSAGPIKVGQDVTGRIILGSSPSITVGGDINGGAVIATGKLGGVKVGGSLIGTFSNDTGLIRAQEIGTVTIARDVMGGPGAPATPTANTGTIQATSKLGSVTVGGSVVAGPTSAFGLTNSGTIVSDGTIGTVVIKGDLIGTSSQRAVISAVGTQATSGTSDLAIKSVSVGGRVEFARILGGYNIVGTGINVDAQIGSVVANDWIASDLATGALGMAEGGFGTPDDVKIPESGVASIIARIGSIIIKNQAYGTPASISTFDHYGFVAEQIGSLKIGGTSFGFTAAPNEVRIVGWTGDLIAREDV